MLNVYSFTRDWITSCTVNSLFCVIFVGFIMSLWGNAAYTVKYKVALKIMWCGMIASRGWHSFACHFTRIENVMFFCVKSAGRSGCLRAGHAHPHPGDCVGSQSDNGEQPLLQSQLQAVSVTSLFWNSAWQECQITQWVVVLPDWKGHETDIVFTLSKITNPSLFKKLQNLGNFHSLSFYSHKSIIFDRATQSSQ